MALNQYVLFTARDMFSKGRISELTRFLSEHDMLQAENELVFQKACELLIAHETLGDEIFQLPVNELEHAMLRLRFFTDLTGNFFELDTSLDGMAEEIEVSAVSLLCHFANMLVPRQQKCTVVLAVRDEGPWLVEWIAHYRALGADDIYLFYNDISDGSEDLMRLLAQHGYIKCFHNTTAASVSPQKKAYSIAAVLLPAVQGSEWAAFLDADEFLWPAADAGPNLSSQIEKIVRQSPAERVDTILVHWMWYGDAAVYKWGQQPVTRRFEKATLDNHVKCVARTRSIWSMHAVHFPILAVPIPEPVYSDGTLIQKMSAQIDPPVDGVFRLNHYFAKSFQEFALKRSRGRGDLGRNQGVRDYSDFLWGANSFRYVEQSNLDLINKSDAIMETILAHPDISEAAELTNKISREKIEKIEVGENLKQTYDRLINPGA